MNVYDYETKELIHKERNDPYQISFNVNVFLESEAAIDLFLLMKYYTSFFHEEYHMVISKATVANIMAYLNDVHGYSEEELEKALQTLLQKELIADCPAVERHYYFPIQHKAWVSINGKSYLDMFEFMKYFNDTNTRKVLYWLIQCQKQNRNTHTCSQLIHYTSLDKNQLYKIFVDLLASKLISVNTFIFDDLAVVRVHALAVNKPEKVDIKLLRKLRVFFDIEPENTYPYQ